MIVKTILVATDFSSEAGAALEFASVLARSLDALLLIVHVKPVPDVPGPYDDVYDPQEPIEHGRLDAVQPADPDVRYEHRFSHGHPAHEIVQLAEKDQADMIVMGVHGETKRKDEPMGSVAQRVLQQASCPVLTVHIPHDSNETGQSTTAKR